MDKTLLRDMAEELIPESLRITEKLMADLQISAEKEIDKLPKHLGHNLVHLMVAEQIIVSLSAAIIGNLMGAGAPKDEIMERFKNLTEFSFETHQDILENRQKQ